MLRTVVRAWRSERGHTATIDYEQEDGSIDRTRPWWTLHDASATRGGGSALRATLYLAPAQEDVCPGSGRPWGTGTGMPICPVCHRGPRALGTKKPLKRLGHWTGTVPSHQQYHTI